MTTPPSFGLSESVIRDIDDCVHLLRMLQEKGLLLGSNTINGLPIPEELANATKNIMERIVEAKAFHASVESIMFLVLNVACADKAVPVESVHTPPEEAPRFVRDEADDGVVRRLQEDIHDGSDLEHRWCPECFDSSLLTPLQEIEPLLNRPISVRYCSRCETVQDSPPRLVSQYRDWLGSAPQGTS